MGDITIPMKKRIRPGEDPRQIAHALSSINSGTLYAKVMASGRSLIPNLYPDIRDEINHRTFATMVRPSYTKIPEYYTLPLNAPYIDHGPTDPYARFAKQPAFLTSDQTPELLLEPFDDNLVRSWSTMSSMIDMHSKKLTFIIIKDEDVIDIYHKLYMFLDYARDLTIPPEAKEFLDYLNRMFDFVNELRDTYYIVCRKKKIKFIDGIADFLFSKAVAL